MSARDRLDFLSDSWNRTRPELDISPWQVWGRVTRVHELFQLAVGRVLRGHGLAFTEFQAMAALVLSGPPYEANPNAIASFNLLTSGGLANLLGRMEREGLIERRTNPDDRRGVIVRLTESGLEHFDAAVLEENRVEHDMLAALSPEERQVLSLLLRKLLLSIDPDMFGDPDGLKRKAEAGPPRPARRPARRRPRNAAE
ncbi:MAG: MarR family transcriptional regulator [Hyphomonadaceae bacterium]|nr:MarR family transcriptional regulator [Hyphomonadaceae bacterium]